MNMTTPALEDYFRAVSLGPFDATNYVSRGIGLAAIKEFGDAPSDYNEAIRLRPEYGDANKELDDLLLLWRANPNRRFKSLNGP